MLALTVEFLEFKSQVPGLSRISTKEKAHSQVSARQTSRSVETGAQPKQDVPVTDCIFLQTTDCLESTQPAVGSSGEFYKTETCENPVRTGERGHVC